MTQAIPQTLLGFMWCGAEGGGDKERKGQIRMWRTYFVPSPSYFSCHILTKINLRYNYLKAQIH